MTTALYRRYRPETFADVIGQEHVTEPLMQALRTGRVNHAYLFSGPRGCGKTTSARILARCLNCEQGPTPEPCGVCDSCVALARGGPGSIDVIEIDAASHGGVDDARDLRERASFGPASSRYKIYIIDEAHMVTPQGFNALLKIVEEPPEHVKFVFATTEPEKVIGTIRSRTHHYPFRLVPPQKLTAYMERLLAQEQVPCEPGVLSFVTRAGGGSVRDSLSVLDQLIAGSGPEGLTYAGAASLLGFTDDELLSGIVEAFAAGDGAAVFRHVDRVVEAGADPRRFVEDLLERLRDLIVVAALEDGAGAVLRSVPADQVERLRQEAATFGAGALSRAADVINAGLTEMTGATSPRLQLELMCARVLLPGMAGVDGYAARLDRMERRLDMGELPQTASAGVVPHAPAAPPAENSAPVARTDQQPGTADRSEEAGPVARPAPGERLGHLVDTPQQTPIRGMSASPAPAVGVPEPVPAAVVHTRADESGAAAAPRTGGMSTDDVRRMWPDVLDRVFRIKRVTWTLLSQNAQVIDFDGQRLLLGASSEGLAATMSRGQHPEVVRQALVEAVGIDVRVEAQVMQPGEGFTQPSVSAPADRERPAPTGGSGASGDSTSSLPDAVRAGASDAGARGTSAHVDPAEAGDPPARPAPREAATVREDEGLRAAAARSSAWASDSPGDWASQATAAAPEWATSDSTAGTAGSAQAEWAAGAPDNRASSVPAPAHRNTQHVGPTPPAGDEPPPDPMSETPAWMEDEPETDVEAVYDPIPARHASAPEHTGEPPPAQAQGVSAPVRQSAQSADEDTAAFGAGSGVPLTPRQRAVKLAREQAQRDEDGRRGVDDDVVSPDDEDIENSDSVGLPVIKSVLGGTVIKDEGPVTDA